MKKALQITILHELPNRLRVGLSEPLRDPQAGAQVLQSHAGVEPIRYSAEIQTLLVRFDPSCIQREELLVRIALALSLENDFAPVRIRQGGGHDSLSLAEALSAATLLASYLARGIGAAAGLQKRLNFSAAALTGGAVLAHGAREICTHRVFHPETLSLLYLGIGALRGRALQAALVTWFAAFGRHLMEMERQAIQIKPTRAGDSSGISVSAVPASYSQSFLRILPELIRLIQHAGQPLDNMLENLREMSREHDGVLHALGPWQKGIPVEFKGA